MIKLLEKSFASPLKEAREHFEKEYLINSIKEKSWKYLKNSRFYWYGKICTS